jgi:hypothetical protein
MDAPSIDDGGDRMGACTCRGIGARSSARTTFHLLLSSIDKYAQLAIQGIIKPLADKGVSAQCVLESITSKHSSSIPIILSE